MAEKRRRRRKRLPADPVETTIETLSNEGRGIARVEGRTVFVDQALAGETVCFQYTRLNSKIAEAKVVEVKKASPQRVDAKCSVFGICGCRRLGSSTRACEVAYPRACVDVVH